MLPVGLLRVALLVFGGGGSFFWEETLDFTPAINTKLLRFVHWLVVRKAGCGHPKSAATRKRLSFSSTSSEHPLRLETWSHFKTLERIQRADIRSHFGCLLLLTLVVTVAHMPNFLQRLPPQSWLSQTVLARRCLRKISGRVTS